MSGKTDEMKGRTIEALGDLTDDEELLREGRHDQAAGNVKQKIDDAANWAKEKIESVEGDTDRD